MKKLRIAQYAPLWESVPPKLYGGIERIVYNLLEGLSKRGHDVTLFASGDSTKEYPLVSVCPVALFRDTTVKRPQAYNYLMLKKLLDMHGEFDVIHDHTFYEPLILSQVIKTPMIHTLHLEVADEMKELFDVCDNVSYVAISENQKRVSKMSSANVIYNGVDTSLYHCNLQPKSDYVVWLGRISHIKGTKESILAAKEAGENIILAGKINKEDEEYYQQQIKPLIDGDKVKFIGEVDDAAKSKLLGDAKALLNLINWDEPYGLVPVEAMACGTPVITTNRGAMPEVVCDGVSGYVVKDWKEAAHRLKDIDKISRHSCRSWVDDNFSIDKMIDGYEKLYYEKIV
jgi:glycosyltransferase involved in cell wall biosynthesis